MSGAPSVTVLLPVRNAAPYLREALESLRSQTLESFEILAIDNGSTDGSEQILRSHGDPRLRVVSSNSRGLVAVLNHGLQLCATDYVARMDADDRSLPQRLERQLRALEADSSLVMVGSRMSVIDARGQPLASPAVLRDDRALRRVLAVANCFAHGAVMYRRAAVLKAGAYRESAERVEDYDLWMRLAGIGKLANLPDALYEWRSHPGGVSRRGRAIQRAAADQLADRYWVAHYAASGPAPEEAWSDIWTEGLDPSLGARLHLEFARGYVKHGSRDLARRHVQTALARGGAAALAWGYRAGMLLPASWFVALESRARLFMERMRGW